MLKRSLCLKQLINFPRILLSLISIRGLIFGVSAGEAAILIALCGLEAYYQWLQSKEEPIANKELKDRLVDIEEQTKSLKDKVSAMSLGASLKR